MSNSGISRSSVQSHVSKSSGKSRSLSPVFVPKSPRASPPKSPRQQDSSAAVSVDEVVVSDEQVTGLIDFVTVGGVYKQRSTSPSPPRKSLSRSPLFSAYSSNHSSARSSANELLPPPSASCDQPSTPPYSPPPQLLNTIVFKGPASHATHKLLGKHNVHPWPHHINSSPDIIMGEGSGEDPLMLGKLSLMADADPLEDDLPPSPQEEQAIRAASSRTSSSRSYSCPASSTSFLSALSRRRLPESSDSELDEELEAMPPSEQEAAEIRSKSSDDSSKQFSFRTARSFASSNSSFSRANSDASGRHRFGDRRDISLDRDNEGYIIVPSKG